MLTGQSRELGGSQDAAPSCDALALFSEISLVVLNPPVDCMTAGETAAPSLGNVRSKAPEPPFRHGETLKAEVQSFPENKRHGQLSHWCGSWLVGFPGIKIPVSATQPWLDSQLDPSAAPLLMEN